MSFKIQTLKYMLEINLISCQKLSAAVPNQLQEIILLTGGSYRQKRDLQPGTGEFDPLIAEGSPKILVIKVSYMENARRHFSRNSINCMTGYMLGDFSYMETV